MFICTKSVFIPVPKKDNAKDCPNYRTIVLTSHASKAMLKILQARLQQCMIQELPDVQAGFRKGRGTRDQIANISWIIERAGEFQKSIYFHFINYTKALTVWITTNCGKFLKRWKYHTILPASYTQVKKQQLVKIGHRIMDWFQIGKGVHQGCILSPCLFNLYAEYSMQNAGLDEVQAVMNISGRNINSLRYADDTTLMVESEEELNSLLMNVKEESKKAGLKLSIQ